MMKIKKSVFRWNLRANQKNSYILGKPIADCCVNRKTNIINLLCIVRSFYTQMVAYF